MSVISPISTVTGRTTPTTDKTQMGKDDFLKLLMAQLSNQDPSSPMDAQAFVAQLATLSAVEAQQKTNAQLDSLVMAQAASNQLQAAALLGDTVTFASKSVEVAGNGASANIPLEFAGNVTSYTLVIKDDHGNIVRTLRNGSAAAGVGDVTWDGLDDKGRPVSAGHYTVTATAADASGAAVDVKVLRRGRVDGLSYGKGYPELRIGSDTITLAEVREVQAP